MALFLESEIILGVKIAKKRHFCLKVVMSVLGVGLVKFFGCLIYGHKLHLVVTLCFLHMSGVYHFLNFEDIFMNS